MEKKRDDRRQEPGDRPVPPVKGEITDIRPRPEQAVKSGEDGGWMEHF